MTLNQPLENWTGTYLVFLNLSMKPRKQVYIENYFENYHFGGRRGRRFRNTFCYLEERNGNTFCYLEERNGNAFRYFEERSGNAFSYLEERNGNTFLNLKNRTGMRSAILRNGAGTRSWNQWIEIVFRDCKERKGDAFIFSKVERRTERVPEISEIEFCSVPSSFLNLWL